MPRKTARSDPPTPFRMPGKPVAGRTANLGFQPVQKTPILGPVPEASVGVDGPRRHRLCQNEVVADLK
jgi:hypothetical protein